MAGRPVTPEDHDAVKRLHAEGHGRNAICKAIGRSAAVVSRIAAEHGLTFTRGPQVQAATEAKKIDAKAKRAALAINLLDDVERLRLQLFAACQAYNFGGKDNTFNMVQLAQPSFRDQQYLMQAIGIGIDRAVRLDEYDSGEAGQVAGLLGALFGRLQTDHGTRPDA